MSETQTPTHPGGEINESALAKGWRLGVADAWRTIKNASEIKWALQNVENLGNKGPPDNLLERHRNLK